MAFSSFLRAAHSSRENTPLWILREEQTQPHLVARAHAQRLPLRAGPLVSGSACRFHPPSTL
eukprot:943176-Pleurochrysis_carterae.AAC.2